VKTGSRCAFTARDMNLGDSTAGDVSPVLAVFVCFFPHRLPLVTLRDHMVIFMFVQEYES